MIKELIEGPNDIGVQSTTFTLDNMGRFLCNTLQEALDSAAQTVGGRKRDFDVIVIGGGTFGAVVAEHLFITDATRSRRILVLEAGPFVLPEHVQNMPFLGGAPDLRVPWVNHPALNYSGLIFAIGGRSLTWGGWSPELLDEEMTAWPPTTRNGTASTIAHAGYFAQSSRQIGVKETNDFIYGPLHTALRKQLHAGLKVAGNETGFTFADLLDHPAVRYPDPGEPPISAALLRDWLGSARQRHHARSPSCASFSNSKRRSPSQSTTLPGLFPDEQIQRRARPHPRRAARGRRSRWHQRWRGRAQAADGRPQLPRAGTHHRDAGGQLGARHRRARLAEWRVRGHPARAAAQRRAKRRGDRAGHGRDDARGAHHFPAVARGPRRATHGHESHCASALEPHHPGAESGHRCESAADDDSEPPVLRAAGERQGGQRPHVPLPDHRQRACRKLGADSEAELFKKIPTLEHLQDMLRATDDTVVITIRGIGDMTPRNPDSFIDLSTPETDFGRPKAVVHLGNAKATPQEFPGSAQTQNDRDDLGRDGRRLRQDRAHLRRQRAVRHPRQTPTSTIPVPAGTSAQRLAALAAFKNRRDDLGTTHHDAGTMRMGDNIADAVTNDFGRIHDTTNCYIAGPALFPTVGSPNPMLTGVALGRRTGDLLNASVLPGPDPVVSPQSEAGFRPLFDGTAATFKNWRLAGPGGGGMLHVNGEMVSYGDGGLRLFYYATEQFGDFTLRLQFRIFDAANHNSGVFVRFPRPTLELGAAILRIASRRTHRRAGVRSGQSLRGSLSSRGSKSRSTTTLPGTRRKISTAFAQSRLASSRTAPARFTKFRPAIASGT